jgi:hypothetical protein
MKFRELFSAAAICVGAAALPAHAALVNQVLVPGLNEFQDTDAERVLRNGVAVTSGNFAVGDIIQTILRFDTINAAGVVDLLQTNGGPLPNHYQLTAVAELRIKSFENCASGQCTFIFEPSGNLGANVFADVYERVVNGGAANSFTQTAAPAAGIAAIQAQTLIAELGIVEADDFWKATSLLDIGAAAAILQAGSPQAANGTFGLSLVSNAGGLPVQTNGILSPLLGGDGNLHDFVGNASAYQRSPGVNDGWLFSSNTTVNFNAVPEPGSLALAGVALLGVGLFGSRRKKN